MTKSLLALSSAALFIVATAFAHADTFDLTGANGATPPCSAIAPCATVTLTGGGSTVTFTVTSLDAGYVFDKFGFNGPSGLTLGPTSGEVSSPTLSDGTHQQTEDGWGKFTYEFDTGENGGSNGGDCTITGGTPSAGCTFSFTVDGTGLTLSEFETVSSNDSNGTTFFAGHEATSNASGYSGESVLIPTPEPSSLLLLGTGILGAGMLVRRRMHATH